MRIAAIRRSRSRIQSRTTTTRCVTSAWSACRRTMGRSAGAKLSPCGRRRPGPPRQSWTAWRLSDWPRSGRKRPALAIAQGARLVVRRGRHRLVRHRRPGHRHLGPQGQGSGLFGPRSAGRRREGSNPGHRLLPRVARRDTRAGRRDGRLGGGGLHGIKIGFGKRGDARLGYEHGRDVAFVSALRAALGPDKAIMIDIGNANRWDVSTAVARVRAMEQFDLAWIEEPLGPDDQLATPRFARRPRRGLPTASAN